MFITVIDKTARIGSDINLNMIIFKIAADPQEERSHYRDMWYALVTVVRGGALKVLIDMHDVDFIDSRGIAILVKSAKHLRSTKGTMALINLNEKVMKIFETLNINRMIPIFDNENEALTHLKYV